jgi:hypothetical protein
MELVVGMGSEHGGGREKEKSALTAACTVKVILGTSTSPVRTTLRSLFCSVSSSVRTPRAPQSPGSLQTLAYLFYSLFHSEHASSVTMSIRLASMSSSLRQRPR